jgi:tight adherence protein C
MDVTLTLIVAMAFAAVAGLVFVGGQYYAERLRLARRLAAGAPNAGVGPRAGGDLGNFVAGVFTEERFGVDNAQRQKLRREMYRAGIFGDNAIRYYVFARLSTVVALPLAVYFLMSAFVSGFTEPMALVLVAIAAVVGVLLPDAYLARRRRKQMEEYRLVFPDLLDLITICMSAGLSVEASFERLRSQMSKRSPALGFNLELMGAEMRAGRGSIDVYEALADRLGIDEASAFVALLHHSVELGGDVGESLRVFSEEMREKRMLRAEEAANKLSVKMIIPLALGIFPVILLIALLPILLRLEGVLYGH